MKTMPAPKPVKRSARRNFIFQRSSFILLFALLAPISAHAATRTWDRANTSVGNWTTDANRSANTRPTAADVAVIDNGGTA